MIRSNNPEETRGRAAKPEETFNFPLTETLSRATRLRFVSYSRFAPSDTVSERTTALITLPLPISIPDNSSIKTTSSIDLWTYGNIDMQQLDQAYDMYSTKAFKDILELGYSAATDSLKRMEDNFKVSGLKALALMPFFSDDTRRTLQLGAGVIQNPHTTLMFEGVNLRHINLTWRLSPRSQQESDAVENIINTVKMRSHPEESFEGFALDYPDLVYVEFTGDVAEYFPKFNKAFVNNIQVNTGSGNGMNFFKGGAPIEKEISISMTEVNIVTRNVLRGEERR